MILIGHELIPFHPFYRVLSAEEIQQTPSNAVVSFDFYPELMAYAQTNALPFALHIKNIKELMLGHAFHALYFIVDKSLVLQVQKIANEYLFDGKILLLSHDENDIEFAASHGIDGIIFTNAFHPSATQG